MNKIIKTVVLLSVLTVLVGCSTEVRIVTDPFSTSIEAPFFGSLGGEDIYAEIGFDLSAARGVTVLASLLQAQLVNFSTLGIDLKVYITLQGQSSTLNKVTIYSVKPPNLIEDAAHRILDVSLPAWGSSDVNIDGAAFPIINQAVVKGAVWIIVHGRITGVALSPQIQLKNLIIDVTARKEMDGFLPVLDLL